MLVAHIADLFEKDLQQIVKERSIEPFVGSPRFQLPPDVSLPEVVEYARRYGILHARELEDAVTAVRDCIASQVSVLDIGCGPGMTARVLSGLNFEVNTYFGLDHAASQVRLARWLNAGQPYGSNFSSRLNVFTPTQKRTLVVMNHICHQTGVTEDDLHHWAMNLNRIITFPYQLLSIEPPLSGGKQSELLEIFKARGRATQTLYDIRTPGQFRTSKVTKLIAIT